VRPRNITVGDFAERGLEEEEEEVEAAEEEEEEI